MHGTIFALAVIAMTCATLIAVKTLGKRMDERARHSALVVALVTCVILAYIAFGHLCNRGGPTGCVLLGTVSAGLLRATVNKAGVRRAMWVGWFVLTLWGMDLCHLAGYVGNPDYGTALQSPQNVLKYVQDRLRSESGGRKALTLPKGWLAPSWQAATGTDFPYLPFAETATTGCYWHTWFTGIFSLHTQRWEVWCPGGPLASCIEKLELRVRAPN